MRLVTPGVSRWFANWLNNCLESERRKAFFGQRYKAATVADGGDVQVVSVKKTVEQKALSLLRALEGAGKSVSCVALEGRRIEIVLSSGETVDEFERIDMRHGKT